MGNGAGEFLPLVNGLYSFHSRASRTSEKPGCARASGPNEKPPDRTKTDGILGEEYSQRGRGQGGGRRVSGSVKRFGLRVAGRPGARETVVMLHISNILSSLCGGGRLGCRARRAPQEKTRNASQ